MTTALGYNPAFEMNQVRNQQLLAMQGGQIPQATLATAPPPAEAMVEGAAAPGAVGDAAMAAAAMQEPPSTNKIVLQSVLKGAMSGASVALGVKQFGPLLMKVGFIGKLVGTLPAAGAAGAAGTGALGFLAKLPVVGSLVSKTVPFLAKSGLAGFAIAGLIGAGVGAVGGFLSGRKKAKAAQEEYETAIAAAQQAAADQIAAQQPEVGDPLNTEPEAGEGRFKSWVVARTGTIKPGKEFANYTTKGESIDQLAKRFYTTPDEIRSLNPDLGDEIPAGTEITLKRKIVPNAKRHRG